MACECINWDILPQIKADKHYRFYHHHPDCPQYQHEQIPRLFYLDETVSRWRLAPEQLDKLLKAEQLAQNESKPLTFRRVDMSQAAFDLFVKHSDGYLPEHEK